MVCYNYRALHESRSGDRCFGFKSKISDLRFEIRRESKERKVRTPQGSEPANGGAAASDSRIQFKIPKAGRRQVQQKIDQPATSSDFEISNLNPQVMGETVRPKG
jgi:hypothetical protein